MNAKLIQKEYWYVASAGIISGAIVFSGQIFANLGLSLFEISILPFLFTILILGPFVVALLGGIALSGWISSGSYLSKRGNNPINTMFGGGLFMLLIMAIIFPIFAFFVNNNRLTHFTLLWPLKIWVFLFIFWLVTKLINHFLFLKGTKKVPMIDSGIIMLLEPVSGAILATIFLHQLITINILIGGALIIFANYLVITQKKEIA